MKQVLKRIWNNITSVFTQEQSINLMLYSIFICFFSNYYGKKLDEKNFLQKRSLFNLVEIQDYDLKEAILTLEESIDWISISEITNMAELKKIIYSLLNSIKIDHADQVMEAIKYLQEFMQESGIECTPESVNQLITQISIAKQADKVADFCAGFAVLGIDACKQQKAVYGKMPEFIAVDFNWNDCAVIKILAWINQIYKQNVRNRNILKEEKEKCEKYDLILVDIPKGMNSTIETGIGDSRFEDCSAKSIYAEWVFVLDAEKHLTNYGRAFAIVSKGALVRRNEQEIRKRLVDRDILEAVITLPANLYASTNMAMELIILDMDKQRKGTIFFGTLADYAQKTKKRQNSIAQEGIEKILEAYKSEGQIDFKIGKRVQNEDVVRQNYSLNSMLYLELNQIQRYIGESIEVSEVASVIRGVQIKPKDEEQLKEGATHFLLGVKNINDGEIIYDEAQKIKAKNSHWKDKYEIKEDDIIITTKGSLIKVAIVPPKPELAYISGNLTIIRIDKEMYPPYLLYEFLLSADGAKILESVQTGSTIKVLNISQLQHMRIPKYRSKEILQYGQKLKENELQYQRSLKALREEYDENRKKIMQQIKEKI